MRKFSQFSEKMYKAKQEAKWELVTRRDDLTELRDRFSTAIAAMNANWMAQRTLLIFLLSTYHISESEEIDAVLVGENNY